MSGMTTSMHTGFGQGPSPYAYMPVSGSAAMANTLPATAPTALNEETPQFTRVAIQGYHPQDFYYNKASSWLQIQARNLIDLRPLDNAVQRVGKHLNGGQPVVDNTPNVFELMGLDELDARNQRASLGDVFRPQNGVYKAQLKFQANQLLKQGGAWWETPQSVSQGTKQFLHASFTKPFTNLAAGREVLSSALSSMATVLFGIDIARKTTRAYTSAYNSGQRDGELAKTTGQEFTKETAKSGTAWLAGSAGASIFGRMFGTNLGFIDEQSRFARFRSLPMRAAYIIGGVLAGSTTQAAMDWALPSLPVVEKVSLNDLKREATHRRDAQNSV
jgi:hypothetical protein